MFFLLYNAISVIIFLPVMLYHLYRALSRGRSPAFAERLGLVPAEAMKKLYGKKVVWLHAVSVGEVIAARPLVKRLKTAYPDHALLLSVTTETGRGVAERDQLADAVVYFPFDFMPSVWASIRQIMPSLVIIMETEIWPNFCFELHRRSIPLFLANGRISDRSFGRYMQFGWFFKKTLALFDRICMQTETDLERIVAIGAVACKSQVCGNLKYDIPFRQIGADERAELRKKYAIATDCLVITLASTHPGEEEILLSALASSKIDKGYVRLVLVPRHPERAAEVAQTIERYGYSCRRRTELAAGEAELQQAGQVLLVDTVGELMNIYAMSDVAYVGGSLVPTGGHNLLEPASLGIPAIFGPCMTNFREIAGLALQYGAAVQVQDSKGFGDALADFAVSPELRHVIGQNGLKMMRANGGATERHLAFIKEVLG